MRFQGKVTIVTGSGQGSGEAIARAFAKEGANVIIADVNEESAKKVAESIKAGGGKATAVKMDVSQTKEVNAAVQNVIKQFGKIDILVNNAAFERIMPFVQTTEDLWDKIIAIDYKGVVVCTRAVLDNMIQNQAGKIISISSDAGKVGSSGEAVYSGCKGAIIAFSKTIAREMARNKINVNVVCPGPTRTPATAKALDENPKLMEALTKAIPFRRIAEPEEIAASVLFLASDDAKYITGQALSVSGGLTMC